MKTLIKTKDIPALRFPGFFGEWEKKRLEDVFERITKKNKKNNDNVLTISAQQGLVNQKKYFTKSVSAKDVSGYYLLNKGDFAYNKSYSKGYPMGAIKKLDLFDEGVVSTLYICFRSKDKKSENFYQIYFDTGKLNREIAKIAQEGVRNHGLLNMSVKDFFEDINLCVPVQQQEQQKIASFLGSVDEWIGNLRAQKESLEKYKKGMMQKIFSQEIRFKDESGKNFVEWEEKKLGELGEFYRGHSYNSQNVKNKGLLVLRSSNIQNEKLVIDNDLQFVNKDCSNEIVLQKNDLAICMANGSKKLVGKAGRYLGDYNGKVTIGAFCSIFRSKLILSQYLFQTIKYKKYLYMALAGTNINNLKNSELEKFKFDFPVSEKEQRKITKFLTSLDNLIESKQQQITQAEKWKKGLMQGLFV